MFLRYFGNLTKLLPATNSPGNAATTVRQLRRLQQQNPDIPALPTNNALDYWDTRLIDAARNSGPNKFRTNKPALKGSDEYTPRRHDETDELSTERRGERTSLVPTFNLAAYVDKSPTLQQLIKMGVDLNSIERRKGLAEFVLKLDFETNIKPHLIFLNDKGVSAGSFGEMITKNPLLFKVEIDDLQTRINYLESKKFTQQQIQRILTINPFWLMFSTQRIDKRLGHFQQEFKLSGDDIRFLASKQPRLITFNMEHIRKSTFCIREEMGFDKDELKCLLLSKPRLWLMMSDELVERFAYAHKEMELSHDMLIQFPEVLTSRVFRLKQRHEFLKMLGRAQYKPENDLYVSPKAVVEGNDYYFAKNVAKSDMKTYELFLKTR